MVQPTWRKEEVFIRIRDRSDLRAGSHHRREGSDALRRRRQMELAIVQDHGTIETDRAYYLLTLSSRHDPSGYHSSHHSS